MGASAVKFNFFFNIDPHDKRINKNLEHYAKQIKNYLESLKRPQGDTGEEDLNIANPLIFKNHRSVIQNNYESLCRGNDMPLKVIFLTK